MHKLLSIIVGVRKAGGRCCCSYECYLRRSRIDCRSAVRAPSRPTTHRHCHPAVRLRRCLTFFHRTMASQVATSTVHALPSHQSDYLLQALCTKANQLDNQCDCGLLPLLRSPSISALRGVTKCSRNRSGPLSINLRRPAFPAHMMRLGTYWAVVSIDRRNTLIFF
jgi:hypothetical protein